MKKKRAATFSCEETGFRVFFTRKFLHTRIPLAVFSSHENCVSRFFFTRKCRCLFFLHTRIAFPAFCSHDNVVACFFFTREFRCPFLHTRIPFPVSSHENSAARFFTREFRCPFLHTRIPLPVSSHENSVARFFTRESRCPFLHTRIPLPVSSHENPAARFFTASRLRVLGVFGRLAGERPPNRRLLSRRAGTCGSLFSQSRVDRASSSNRRYSGIGYT